MHILFVMRHSGYLRNFESTLRLLCDRGHTVQLGFQIGETHPLLDPTDVAGQLERQYPKFSRTVVPVRDDLWSFAARELHLSLDYLRYLGPEYRDAPKLRERATRDVPEWLLRRSGQWPLNTAAGRAAATRWFRWQLKAIPTDPRIDAFLEVHRPDVLAVTPLIEPGAPQVEYLRSARAMGIRTAYCVASWDNLTNKGLVHGHVDRMMVWNESMRREAIELHGIASERVTVTGAQPFDHWFTWTPSTTRAEFCARVGLPADRPYVLYLCSSKFIAPAEVPFVRTWATALRQSELPALRDAGVLVRPHPQNADQWRHADLTALGPLVVWPPAGAPPSDDTARADYFDSMYHSAAVVGINTTAEIESAIVGRPVFTVLAPDFKDTQEGTLHFAHLRGVNGGLLHLAADLPAHVQQIGAAVVTPGSADERCRRFVEAFVRPHGAGVAATPKVVETLEALPAEPVAAPARTPLTAPLARALMAGRAERLQRAALVLRETKAARTRYKQSRKKGTATSAIS
jgi:hypothetical protein